MSSAIDTPPETGLAGVVKTPRSQGNKVQEYVAGSPEGGKTPSPEVSGGSGLDDSPDTASDPPRTSGAPDAGPEVSELVNQLIVEPERSEGAKRKTRAASKDTMTEHTMCRSIGGVLCIAAERLRGIPSKSA